MKKILILLMSIFVFSFAFGVTVDEVKGIKLNHSKYEEVRVTNNGHNVIIYLQLKVKAVDSDKVSSYVIKDTKKIFLYFKKKYGVQDYDVVDINFYVQGMKVANTNAWSDTIEAMNISKLNFNNAESKLDAWYYNWD